MLSTVFGLNAILYGLRTPILSHIRGILLRCMIFVCDTKIMPKIISCKCGSSWLMHFSQLRDIFVFHDGLHVRLWNHSGKNSCPVLVRRLTALQVWPQPIIVYVLACRRGRGLRNGRSWLQKECQWTHCRSCQSRWENLKNSDRLDFLSGSCEASQSHIAVLRLCQTTRALHLYIEPDAGNLSAMTISCPGWMDVDWTQHNFSEMVWCYLGGAEKGPFNLHIHAYS